jgi:hypothetical protein
VLQTVIFCGEKSSEPLMQFAVRLRAVKNPANGLKLMDDTLRRFPEISQTAIEVL